MPEGVPVGEEFEALGQIACGVGGFDHHNIEGRKEVWVFCHSFGERAARGDGLGEVVENSGESAFEARSGSFEGADGGQAGIEQDVKVVVDVSTLTWHGL